MAESGLSHREDGTDVLTIIFQPGELNNYISSAAGDAAAAPLEQTPPAGTTDETLPPDQQTPPTPPEGQGTTQAPPGT